MLCENVDANSSYVFLATLEEEVSEAFCVLLHVEDVEGTHLTLKQSMVQGGTEWIPTCCCFV